MPTVHNSPTIYGKNITNHTSFHRIYVHIARTIMTRPFSAASHPARFNFASWVWALKADEDAISCQHRQIASDGSNKQLGQPMAVIRMAFSFKQSVFPTTNEIYDGTTWRSTEIKLIDRRSGERPAIRDGVRNEYATVNVRYVSIKTASHYHRQSNSCRYQQLSTLDESRRLQQVSIQTPLTKIRYSNCTCKYAWY